MATRNDEFIAEVKGDLRRALQDAFARGPAFATGKPALPEASLRAGGVPERHWADLRADFAGCACSQHVDTLAAKWGKRLVDHYESLTPAANDGQPANAMLEALMGRR